MSSNEYFAIIRQTPIFIRTKKNRKLKLSELGRTVAVIETEKDAEIVRELFSQHHPGLEFRIERKYRQVARQ